MKTVDQQVALMLHRSRSLLVQQHTALANALRAHMAEFGIVAARGKAGIGALVALNDTENASIPALARSALRACPQRWTRVLVLEGACLLRRGNEAPSKT